jgi:3-methyladenine DNA glycosylase AlkD
MKTIHTAEPTQYPAFWNEEWLRRAIDELDTGKMTPEERAYFARVTAANAEAVKAEKQKIREAVEQKEIETIKNALGMGLTLEQSAKLAGVSVSTAELIKQKFIAN